jgi:predicted phosphodiesterase
LKPRLKKALSRALEVDPEALKRLLPSSIDDLTKRLQTTRGRIIDALDFLLARGVMVEEFGGVWSISKRPAPVEHDDKRHLIHADRKGWYRIGVISDTHLGSKYAREDVVSDLYDWYASEGLERVYHCGNWIDGQAHFNKYDLLPEAHGMQAQLELMVRRYPKKKNIKTYYVAGDDHEGWYAQREGIDIGRSLEDTARHSGRTDLVYLGYKEAFITLEHAKSGEHARLLVDHPGGGSAYADSYAAQKRVEAAQPGEKPGVWLFGHWHKIGYFRPRGVHVLLAGCTKDLDPFGRKKGLRYDVGGSIIEMRQDEHGAIVEFTPRIRTYYDRGYHEGTAFSMSGSVKR